jgi:DUF4097 and DUF4098 domain-containing protein YvlB
MRGIVVLLLLGVLIAGCIAPDPPSATTHNVTNGGGSMSAKETRSDDATVCTSGNVNVSSPQEFCATRTITVTGTIAGISEMNVDVSSFNGPVTLRGDTDGQWGFVAKLTATGSTPDEAKANLDNIQFAWSHEQDGSHFLTASAKKDGNGSGYGASFDVQLPNTITYVVVAGTTNGDVQLQDLKTDGLSLHSTNGKVLATGHVSQVDLRTTNGDVTATLAPWASGRFALQTTNGKIALTVPEDDQHGYDATLQTTNGKADVQMHDGDVGPCPQGSQYYTPPCNHRTFQTNGYAAREIQTSLSLESTNGDVTLSAA